MIFSASSEPPWENISSNACRRAASISRTASPWVATAEARLSAFSRNSSVTLSPRVTMVSVMRAPICSSLETTSPPRRLRSSTSESPVDFKVEFTSSPVVAMVSASRLDVSSMPSVICTERSSIICTMASDFCSKPCVTSSRRPSSICARLVVISANSSVMWSVLKFRLAVSRSLALAMACEVSWLASSRRSSMSPPRSPSAPIMELPARPSAMRDVLALLGERRGDAVRAFVELRRDLVADVGNVVGQIEMHAGDGVADLLGLADQGVALMRQRLEQAADADLVVVVGALQRRDLVGDQRFELGGARERPLDAVAHRRDLAADRLADGDHGIARDLFRLGEPHRDVAIDWAMMRISWERHIRNASR